MLASVLAPGLFLAWTAGAPCDDARKLHEALSPERALELADRGLATDPERPLACLEVRALSLLVLGRSEDARGVFAELFTRDPDRRIDDPSLSPPMWLLIESAREGSRPLRVRVAAGWIDDARIRLEMTLEGSLRGARAVRWKASGAPAALAFGGTAPLVGRVATATLSAGSDTPLSGLSVSGAAIGAGGAELTQLAADVLLDARPPRPMEDEGSRAGWWILGGLVTAGAAAAVVSAVVLSQPELPDTAGTIGRVDLDR